MRPMRNVLRHVVISAALLAGLAVTGGSRADAGVSFSGTFPLPHGQISIGIGDPYFHVGAFVPSVTSLISLGVRLRVRATIAGSPSGPTAAFGGFAGALTMTYYSKPTARVLRRGVRWVRLDTTHPSSLCLSRRLPGGYSHRLLALLPGPQRGDHHNGRGTIMEVTAETMVTVMVGRHGEGHGH